MGSVVVPEGGNEQEHLHQVVIHGPGGKIRASRRDNMQR
jgi:hypothetical protein